MRHRVLLIDDSELFIEACQRVIADDANLVVCGTAADADDVVALVQRTAPDVICLDLHMPGVDGLDAITRVLDARLTPIVVMTADPGGRDGFLCMQALARGAVEVAEKPDLTSEAGRRSLRASLVTAARSQLVAGVVAKSALARRPTPPASQPRPARPTPASRASVIVGIAASTGGPAALATVMAALPASLPAGVVIVQHLANGFVHHLARWLADTCPLRVRVAVGGELVLPGDVLLAPDDGHLIVSPAGTIVIDTHAAALDGHRPSATVLFSSLAARGPRSIGVVLSGMGSDGVAGLLALRAAGGATAAQSGSSCVVDGMPGAARAAGAAAVTLDPKGLARWLASEAERR